MLKAIYETKGCAVDVSDEKILEGVHRLADIEGIFVCPEGGALYAAVARLREEGFIKKDDKVVMLNTGAGIKYPDTIEPNFPYLELDAAI